MHLLTRSTVLLAILIFISPFLELREVRLLKLHAEPWRRLRMYRVGIIMSWSFSALCWVLCAMSGLRIRYRSAEPGWIFGAPWRMGVAGALVAGYLVLALMPGIVCTLRPARVPAYTRHIGARLGYFLPCGVKQRRWFAAVSVTAGICEEWIFRGFFPFALSAACGMSLMAATAASTLLFGWNHMYQGSGGIIRTTIAGLAFALLAMLTGGLVVPIVVHAMVDLQLLLIYRPERFATLPERTTAEAQQ